jgi:hypothetical protein
MDSVIYTCDTLATETSMNVEEEYRPWLLLIYTLTVGRGFLCTSAIATARSISMFGHVALCLEYHPRSTNKRQSSFPCRACTVFANAVFKYLLGHFGSSRVSNARARSREEIYYSGRRHVNIRQKLECLDIITSMQVMGRSALSPRNHVSHK